MTDCTNAATEKGAHKCMWHIVTQLEGSEADMNTMEPSNVDTIYRYVSGMSRVSIYQDSHTSNRSGTMYLGCLEWHGTYPNWKIRCIKAWCLLYYLKSLLWQHCSLPEFRTDVKLTGVFARRPRPTQTLSVGTQYIAPWVSKVSSDIMAYGEAGNGNGNRNRNGKRNGKVKL